MKLYSKILIKKLKIIFYPDLIYFSIYPKLSILSQNKMYSAKEELASLKEELASIKQELASIKLETERRKELDRCKQKMDEIGLNPIFREAVMGNPLIAAAIGVYKAGDHIVKDKKNYPEREYIFRDILNSTDYILKIIRQSTGTWNGYVTIPSSHPFATKSYDDLNYEHNAPIELTWKNKNNFGMEFGFDHNHSGHTEEKNYANYDKVRQEVIDLFNFFKKAEGYAEPTSKSGGGGGGPS